MLVLSRKSSESIVIDERIQVMIVAIQGDRVKIGIQAPSSVPVHRAEVQQRIAYESIAPRKHRNEPECRVAALQAIIGREQRQTVAGLGSLPSSRAMETICEKGKDNDKIRNSRANFVSTRDAGCGHHGTAPRGSG